MPLGDLLNSTNTTEEGRVIINSAYTRTCLWTGRTENTIFFDETKNIIPANTTSNNKIDELGTPTIAGNAQFINFSSILGGQNNTIRKFGLFAGFVKNSSIIGGENNLIQTNASPIGKPLLNSVIVGGKNNEIIQPNDDLENVAILGTESKTVTTETTNTSFANNLFSTGGRIKKVRKITIGGRFSGDWVPAGGSQTAPNTIEPDDEIIYITNDSGGVLSISPTSWCIDIGNFIGSENGRCVEIIVKNVFTNFGKGGGSPNTPIGLGYAFTTTGTRYLNRVAMVGNTKSATICESQTSPFASITGETNFLHVKLVVYESCSDRFISMGGTGAP